ncbi:SGNH/GDSL hydrolase family protein [Sphingomonas metalli]|nr:SGNH/GDSL hydrolase family protein [Sphingomonas metalli]
MRDGSVAFGLAAMALALAGPAAAQQQRYDRLFVFGDSLVDSGNAQKLRADGGGADPAPASQSYFEGRFSNGYNFADYLSTYIAGGPATASERGGINFSVGGAQAAEVAGDASPSFLEQIDTFAKSGATFDSRALVLVTLGGNDVRRELANLGTIPGYTPDLTSTVQAMSTGLTRLYAAGARNFVITGLPDIGQIPAVTSLNVPALNQAGTALSAGLNTAFAQLVGGFDRQPGVDAVFFDLFNYQKAIYQSPAAAGLVTPGGTLNTSTPCLSVPGAAPNCDNFVYFDAIHPVTDVHRAIANGIATQIGVAVPEPASWALMLTGFALTAMMLRRHRTRVRVAFA